MSSLPRRPPVLTASIRVPIHPADLARLKQVAWGNDEPAARLARRLILEGLRQEVKDQDRRYDEEVARREVARERARERAREKARAMRAEKADAQG